MMTEKNQSVSKALFDKGYCFVPGAMMQEYVTDPGWSALVSQWGDLGPDNYLNSPHMYRLRRYGQLTYVPGERLVARLPEVAYFQSDDINRFAGGKHRQFFPLTDELIQNAIFRRLLAASFAAFELPSEYCLRQWTADVHQFRIVSQAPAVQGHPTPEGVHRDGFPFGSIHLLRRERMVGGETTMYTLRDQPIESLTLAAPMDSMFVVDTRVKHGVSSVSAEDARGGVRDILIFGFYLPGSLYDRG